MNVLQLQNDIFDLVKKTEDKSLLQAIKTLLSQDDEVYVLSDFEKQFLAESEADYEKR